MKQTLILFAFVGGLCSCTNNAGSNSADTKDTVSNIDTAIMANAVPVPECYAQAGKDTVLLQITTKNDGVNGTLYIHLDGKDMNQGHLVGEMKGDTLLAEYTFYSEGTQSVRQVAFLKQENAMVEGYGEVAEKENKMIFKNTGALKFDDKTKLTKVDCSK